VPFKTLTCITRDLCFDSFTSPRQSTSQATTSQDICLDNNLFSFAHARSASQQHTKMATSTAYQRATVEDANETPQLQTSTNGNGNGGGNGNNNNNNNVTVGADDPEPAPQPEPITIIFADVNGFELSFRLKQHTKLGKAMEAFAKRTERDPGTLRFLFEGERLLAESTTESVSLAYFQLAVSTLRRVWLLTCVRWGWRTGIAWRYIMSRSGAEEARSYLRQRVSSSPSQMARVTSCSSRSSAALSSANLWFSLPRG